MSPTEVRGLINVLNAIIARAKAARGDADILQVLVVELAAILKEVVASLWEDDGY